MYLDTAIIVKLLVPEQDSAFFDDQLAGAALSTSELALSEVCTALFAKERNKAITSRHRTAALRTLDRWVESEQLIIHPLNSITLRKANRVVEACHPQVPLRTLDAIHVAACDLSQDLPLCTSDKRMRDAASLLDIAIFPAAD